MFYHKDKNGNMTAEYEEGTKEYYANDLLKNYLALLCDAGKNGENRTAHLQHASIDGDTKLLTDILDDIEGVQKEYTPLLPYGDLSLRSQVQTKEEFITGKFGIGPFALNNNNHILTTLYGVEFQPTDNFGKLNILARLGLTSLHKQVDRDGNSIMSWISGLINSHVDVAKDSFIIRLGVNKYTYDLTNLLIRTGLGKTTFYMLTQPIMKQLSTAYNMAAGQFMQRPGITQYWAQKEATDNVLFEAFAKVGIEGDSLKTCVRKFGDYIFDKYKMSTRQAIEDLFSKQNTILHRISKNGLEEETNTYGIVVNEKQRNLTGNEIQLLVAIAKLEFDPYAQGLADLVKYSKIDTNKHGKNITEQCQYLLGYHKIFDRESTSWSRRMFEPEGLNRMLENSYIKTKTLNATKSFLSILQGQILEATVSFQRAINQILRQQNISRDTSIDTLNKLTRKILIKIKSNYFFAKGGYCERNGIDPKSLVSGPNTIYDRLNKLKSDIITDKRYSGLRDKSGEINNYLLKSLIHSFKWSYDYKLNPAPGNRPDTYQDAKFIKLFNFTEEDTIDQDSIIEAWEELLNDGKYPELQKFARDLVVYAFMTSGDSGNITDLFKYVPNSWKTGTNDETQDQSYASYIEQQLLEYNEAEESLLSNEDVVDILQNSWYDDDLVPSLSNGDLYIFNTVTFSGQSSPSILIPGQSADLTNIPLVFKIPRRNSSDKFSQRQYDLYTLFYINDRPIYVAIDPKGSKYVFGHHIYEMSRQDNKVTDATVSLLNDGNMVGLATQLGLSANNIQSFLEELINKLNDNPVFAKGLVDNKILPEEIASLSNAYGQEDESVNDQKEQSVESGEIMELEQLPTQQLTVEEIAAPDTKPVPKEVTIDVNTISDKTEAFGVEISNGSKDFWGKINNGWQQNNPSGIVAYRKYGDKPESFSVSTVNEGWIGNPFSTESKGPKTVQQFYEWLVTGNNLGNKRATEQFRQAIIQKILSAPKGTKVLYYTELGRPSHATVIGYLIDNKHLLKPDNKPTSNNRPLSDVEEQLGRKIITPSNVPFITEHLQVSVGGKQYDQQTLNRFYSNTKSMLNELSNLGKELMDKCK